VRAGTRSWLGFWTPCGLWDWEVHTVLMIGQPSESLATRTGHATLFPSTIARRLAIPDRLVVASPVTFHYLKLLGSLAYTALQLVGSSLLPSTQPPLRHHSPSHSGTMPSDSFTPIHQPHVNHMQPEYPVSLLSYLASVHPKASHPKPGCSEPAALLPPPQPRGGGLTIAMMLLQ
jgi:hypothetical protein